VTPNRSTSATDVQRGRRFGTRDLIIVALTLAVAFLVYEQVSAKVDAINATQQAQDMAEPLDRLCRDDPETRRRVGDENCDQAASVQAEPPPVAIAQPEDGTDGTDGDDGDPGRGIVTTAITGGHLYLTYTDGTTEDKGVVVGPAGPTGAPGIDGERGRGVTSSTVSGDGELVIAYTDGTSEVAGVVVGRDGVDGRDGERGRGVARTEVVDGRLLVTYDDGTADDAGPVVGPRGRGVATLDLDLDRCVVTIHYDDGSPSEERPVTGCDVEEPPPPTTTTEDLELPLPGN
jgi:hypothetical protein